MTTHIVVVMDRSGSMSGMASEAAASTNEFIRSLKDIEGSKSITIHQFDDKFETTCSQVAQSKVPELVAFENYVPRGLTALYDAVGNSITKLGKKKNVVMCIVTDGMENASKEFTFGEIKALIDDKTNAGWKFDFLSSDIKAMNLGMELGMNKGICASDRMFAASVSGYADTVAMRTSSVAEYMSKVK